MTITFQDDIYVIVYALDNVISYARNNQYIFLAQIVWWISSIIGLQPGLIAHIDILKSRDDSGNTDLPKESLSYNIHPDRIGNLRRLEVDNVISDNGTISTTESNIHNEVINNCEAFLQQSYQERKAIGRQARKERRTIKAKVDREKIRKNIKPILTVKSQIGGINRSEVKRRKAAGECQHCAWPRDEKRSHSVLDCIRRKRFAKGTAQFPKIKLRIQHD